MILSLPDVKESDLEVVITNPSVLGGDFTFIEGNILIFFEFSEFSCL
jgi:hypothetical protein